MPGKSQLASSERRKVEAGRAGLPRDPGGVTGGQAGEEVGGAPAGNSKTFLSLLPHPRGRSAKAPAAWGIPKGLWRCQEKGWGLGLGTSRSHLPSFSR